MKCPDCDGGKIPFPVCSTEGEEEEVPVEITVMISCPTCKGTGRLREEDEE